MCFAMKYLKIRIHNSVNIRISADFYLLLACMILLLPAKWVIAFYAAAMVHELFHAVTLLALGGSITELSFKAGGIYMAAVCEGAVKQIVCSLAGPLGGLFCLLLAEKFPEMALCGLVHSLYNLLPLWPLDGGRVLRLILDAMCPHKSHQIEGYIRKIFLILGLLAVLWLGIYFRSGIFFWICGISVLANSMKNTLQRRKEQDTIGLPKK